MVAVGVEMYSRAAMPDKTALFLRINLTSSLQKKKQNKTKQKKKETHNVLSHFRKGEIIDKNKKTTTTPFFLAQSFFFGNSELSCVKVYLTFACSLSFLYIYLPMHLF